ncbi:MAG TPA: DUF5908 family protein [Bacteroidales bacterium]|nr:DUF5908 family protein [Bacteroidales bacterium]HPS18205.1 DUF5908 family protein [Bacteroidales bacterium]
MPIQINELVIRAEVNNNNSGTQQTSSSCCDSAKYQKVVDELTKIIKNKNER